MLETIKFCLKLILINADVRYRENYWIEVRNREMYLGMILDLIDEKAQK